MQATQHNIDGAFVATAPGDVAGVKLGPVVCINPFVSEVETALARAKGRRVATAEAGEDEVTRDNSQAELHTLEHKLAGALA